MPRRRLSRGVRLGRRVNYTYGFIGRNRGNYTINLHRGRKVIGGIDVHLDHRAKMLQVFATVIDDESLEHRGIGTKLYEAGAALACRMGVKFGSSAVLNKKSGGFWKKQVRKGRAKLVSHTDHRGLRHRIYVLNNSCVGSLAGLRSGGL